MKYRIKKVVYKDGTAYYYPQYRKFFRWHTFKADGTNSLIVPCFRRAAFAENYIDQYIKRYIHSEIKKISYIKYKPSYYEATI